MDGRPGGKGRGRGRGKPVGQQPTDEENPKEARESGLEQQLLSQLRVTEQPGTSQTTPELELSKPSHGGIGRGRGRGVPIGRGRGSALPQLADDPCQPVQSAQDLDTAALAERYQNDEPELPRTPPKSETRDDQSSPDTSSPKEDIKTDATIPDTDAKEELPPAPEVKPESIPSEPPPVHRRGEKGKGVVLKTNYLRLRRKEDSPGIVEYHVSFTSEDAPVESTSLRREVLRQIAIAQEWKVRGFDGMILFLPYILPHDVTVFEEPHPNIPTATITVKVTFTKVRPMKDCVIFYNILLNRVMRALKYVELRREHYDLDRIERLSQHKLEIWHGENLSAENQEDGLMIWVDACSRVLRTETVYDYYKMIANEPNMRSKFEDFIVGKIVLTKYNNRCYRIDKVDWDMNPGKSFQWKDKQITFADYIMSQQRLRVTDMQQPMLISKLKPPRDQNDEDTRICALIPEFCHLTGLTEDQKKNFKVMTDLAKSTRLTPAQRMRELKIFTEKLLGSEEAKKILADWGLYIDKNVIEVGARKMDGPDLVFSDRHTLTKAGPDFSRESGQNVFAPVPTKKFIVLCTQRDKPTAERFMDVYKQVCAPLGIRMMEAGQIVLLKGMNPHNYSEALQQYCDPNKLHFVVIVMPTSRDDVYSAIKRHCIASSPIPSQCVLTKTLSNEKRLRSIVLKIALQINCKLGGALWALHMPLKDSVMFVGIDVAHDPRKKDPSVICLIASLNNMCTRYYSRSDTRRVHEELATSLNTMMQDALKVYRKENNGFPSRIVVFRDGGSVGALEVIMATEVGEIKKAVEDTCGEKALSGFTFVVVTKRIPQRFVKDRGVNDFVNPDPGTVIDSGVTRRFLYDYYIVSQSVREGTVNPTHFVVVDTNSEIRPDLIQKLTYVTCFMYYNWPGTVRVPAMVQYAHKLAALLQRHVQRYPHEAIRTTLYYL